MAQSLEPVSDSVSPSLAQSLEPVSDSVSPSLAAPLPFVLCLSLSPPPKKKKRAKAWTATSTKWYSMSSKRMKRCTTSLILKEPQIKTTMNYITAHTPEGMKLKHQQDKALAYIFCSLDLWTFKNILIVLNRRGKHKQNLKTAALTYHSFLFILWETPGDTTELVDYLNAGKSLVEPPNEGSEDSSRKKESKQASENPSQSGKEAGAKKIPLNTTWIP